MQKQKKNKQNASPFAQKKVINVSTEMKLQHAEREAAIHYTLSMYIAQHSAISKWTLLKQNYETHYSLTH